MPKDNQGRWDEETKREAVAQWLIRGSLTEASKATGMPISTIQRLKSATPEWFEKVSQQVWAEVDEKMVGRYQQINDKATKELIDRLEKGDTRVLSNGKKVKVPVGARDLVNIAGIAQDKLKLIQGRTHAPAQEAPVTQESVLERMKADIAARLAEVASQPDSNVKVLKS